MAQQFVLFEHAAGYALFKVTGYEEIGTFLQQVEESVTDVSRFSKVAKLVGFSPFKTAINALENINAVSEGIISSDLQLFLETWLPKPGKKEKVVLGVSDAKIGASISETLRVTCSHIGIFPEMIRGIRMHFAKLVQGFTAKSSATAQLGLGHAYSRAKIKFNIHKSDNTIIQTIALLDLLDKDINNFAMRIREWYSYHFPELVKIVPENYLYSKLVKFIKNRKELTEESLEGLEEIVMDGTKAQAILDAARSSMGMDISPIDLINIEMFASRVISLSDYRKHLSEYLSSKMNGVAPNLKVLVGDLVGARLISHAGSLMNLAKYPASTVQILGAEKALFRALKKRSNTPKYGLIFHSSFISRAATRNKGRISRYLANKCSIASRIDCFSDVPTNIFGEKLKQQVEDRLKFYEVGEIPKKNIDVMKEAVVEANQVIDEIKRKEEKKKKKELKRKKKMENGVNHAENNAEVEKPEEEYVEEPPKKKKKKKKDRKDE